MSHAARRARDRLVFQAEEEAGAARVALPPRAPSQLVVDTPRLLQANPHPIQTPHPNSAYQREGKHPGKVSCQEDLLQQPCSLLRARLYPSGQWVQESSQYQAMYTVSSIMWQPEALEGKSILTCRSVPTTCKPPIFTISSFSLSVTCFVVCLQPLH